MNHGRSVCPNGDQLPGVVRRARRMERAGLETAMIDVRGLFAASLLCCAVAAGCTTSWRVTPVAVAAVMVDPAIAPVSRSAPGTAAAAILRECGAATPDRSSMVSGVGLVPHARDVPRHIRSYGVEPELQSDEPTWVVQFSGRLQVGNGDWADNLVCVVVGANPPVFYAPDAHTESGNLVQPTGAKDPALLLPSMAP